MKQTSFYGILTTIVCICYAVCGCTHEEAVGCKVPSVRIDSCVACSENMFEAYLTVDKGTKFNQHSVELHIYDSDDLGAAPRIEKVQLTDESNQQLCLPVMIDLTSRSYLVYATLTTQNNRFTSAPQTVVRYQHDLNYEYVTPHFPYGDTSYRAYCEAGIGRCLMRGELFWLYLDGKARNLPVTVKIGDRTAEMRWGDGWLTSGGSEIYVRVPDDMVAGDYDVTIDFGFGQQTADEKVRILPWRTDYVTDPAVEVFYSCEGAIRIGDKMYYLSQPYNSNTTTRCYDIHTKTWSKKSDASCRLTQLIACSGDGYAFSEGSTPRQLMKYDVNADRWSSLGEIPTTVVYGQTVFSVGTKIFIGGGYYSDNLNQVDVNEFYSFDVKTLTWERLNDMPLGGDGLRTIATCGGEKVAYVLTGKGKLWRYEPTTDTWTREPMLKQAYTTQTFNVAMIQHGDDVIVVGGERDQAVHAFNTRTREWRVMALYERSYYHSEYFARGIFVNAGKLVVGPQAFRFADMDMEFLEFEMDANR